MFLFGYATLMLARVDAMCVSPATQPLDVGSMKTRATQQKNGFTNHDQ